MNENEKIIEVLSEHKKHSNAFREEIKVGLNTVVIKIEGVNRRLDISNGRTAKLENATAKLENTINELEKTDLLINERMKNMKDGSKMISDRMWTIIFLIISAGIGYFFSILK